MSQQTNSSSSNAQSQIKYESLNRRIIRKFKEQPLIPLGIIIFISYYYIIML
ncbi:hypothetical protein RhiirA1_414765 [Rhizophagus irregularis]|uniref:Uncharacterized protein n=1 Tax=Rhizophagus irregularis TaxID=588596 RepID=A0A2I1EAY7_9GLOM|nr:hypothetical protein RhiirA1_414765 [Rhizophagus irregularis]PKY19274.1 hypothetical protein RhiirB3_406646 [Rhizophagus irregularis]